MGRIKSEESLVKTRPNYLVLAVWQTRLRKSCLVYTMKKRPFFWGRGQFAVYFGKFNRRLVTNGDGQMSPLSIPLSCTFLEEIYNLQIFVAPYSLLWYPCMILIMLGVRQFEIELCHCVMRVLKTSFWDPRCQTYVFKTKIA